MDLRHLITVIVWIYYWHNMQTTVLKNKILLDLKCIDFVKRLKNKLNSWRTFVDELFTKRMSYVNKYKFINKCLLI